MMNGFLFRFATVVTSLALAATVASAQDTRPAEQVYKNIKVMKGIPAAQMLPTMHLIKAALGVGCDHCHIEPERERDDLPAKEKAREMYLMMTAINRANFQGNPVVTCYTCHKGHVVPEGMPSLPAPQVAEGVEAAAQRALPSVDDIVAKYIRALGGEAAIRKVTTRVIIGSQDLPTGPGGTVPAPAKLERLLKAPNLVSDVYTTDKFTMSTGFDGKVQWTKAANGNVTWLAPDSVDGERAARAAAFYEPLTLQQQYRTLAVEGTARINGKDTYVVVGTPAANTAERLYFEVRSGLLLRKSTYIETAVGRSPFQVEFDDYRNTGSGMKIPFVIRMSPAGPRTELHPVSTLRITSVKDNVPVDEARFAKPAAATR